MANNVKDSIDKKDISSKKIYRNVFHRRAYPYIGNNSVSVTDIEYSSPKLAGFEGFKILHISDLHNHSFGKKQSNLISLIKKARPDIIVSTGDLIDRRRPDIGVAMAFIREAVKIAPVYFVTGNHEAKSDKFKELSAQLTGAGVHMIDNESVSIKRSTGEIRLIGLPDIAFFGGGSKTAVTQAIRRTKHNLNSLISENTSSFNILLSHRPELVDMYSSSRADLVMSGHAHGGQMRLPALGGLYAPGQGILPKLTSGMYKKGKTALIVSRGLGNSLFPLRIFNPPEIIALTLKSG